MPVARIGWSVRRIAANLASECGFRIDVRHTLRNWTHELPGEGPRAQRGDRRSSECVRPPTRRPSQRGEREEAARMSYPARGPARSAAPSLSLAGEGWGEGAARPSGAPVRRIGPHARPGARSWSPKRRATSSATCATGSSGRRPAAGCSRLMGTRQGEMVTLFSRDALVRATNCSRCPAAAARRTTPSASGGPRHASPFPSVLPARGRVGFP